VTDDVSGPTPEGQLIRRVRDLSIPKLSIRAAAERIGLSPEQWGYIERGYRPTGAGQPPRPFSPPAATLARMACALDISPERLESEGQRPDAAEILREMIVPALGEPPMGEGPRSDADRPYAMKVLTRLLELAKELRVDAVDIWTGQYPVTGAQMFGAGTPDAAAWDRRQAHGWTVNDLVWMVADLRRHDVEQSRQSQTG
jgi:transcriptional regulator with XRE-family HTH domain